MELLNSSEQKFCFAFPNPQFSPSPNQTEKSVITDEQIMLIKELRHVKYILYDSMYMKCLEETENESVVALG